MTGRAYDNATLEGLYNTYRHKVYRLGLRYGRGSQQWAEDLTQDVFMRLFEHLSHLDQTSDLGGWLYRVATNVALHRLRHDRSWLARVQGLLRASDPEFEPGADVALEGREAEAAGLEAVHALPPKEKVVMLMRLVDGKKQSEIAELLSMSKGQVSKLLARGRAHLAQQGWEVGDAED